MDADFDPNGPALEGSGIYGLLHQPADAGVVLIPVPWEPTTSYGGGTAGGPAAILAASKQVDLFDFDTGRPYEAGIAMLPESPEVRAWNEAGKRAARPVIEAGGAMEGRAHLRRAQGEVNALGEKLNAWVRATAVRWLDAGKLCGVVGGDHSAPLGAIEEIGRRHPGLGILHLDAHADLRDAYEGFVFSHASIMFNVVRRVPGVARLVQVGLRDVGEAEMSLVRESAGRIVPHFDAELRAAQFRGETWAAACARIVDALPRDVYLSYDIDGLDPDLCPHTGTPVPGGLSFAEIAYLTGEVVRSGRRIVGFDLCEVTPGPAGDEWDANVGARLLYRMIGFALRSRGGR